MIDTHLHVWDRSRSRYRWLDGAPEPLRSDHPLEQGLAALAPYGVERAILVQADETLDETTYLLELVAAEPRLAGAVCYLPLEDPDTVARELPRLAATAGFVGVRNLSHDRPDPDWILGAEQRRSIGLLEEAGVPLDYVSVLPRHLENVVTLAGEHPGLTVVLDHLGKPPVGRDDDYRRWTDRLADAAALANVVAKVSGIYPAEPAEPAEPAAGAVTPEQLDSVLTIALATFGPDRLMLGSDWPVSTVSGGADATMSVLVGAVDRLPREQALALRRGTATRVYGLGA
ncbi:metal-dependent hydrolase [Occultella glacieicola]|uniref:Metal-dependent hydrolase n=1 Tax=Occultella glacieicola TaxID=2518684 RepID=A0ABY2E5P1_9MICO|nr:amidohydrolase family protein [Occultella glacieicola]TDE95123.1 metal-dependent hydrolase [Occultella glacieicola]